VRWTAIGLAAGLAACAPQKPPPAGTGSGPGPTADGTDGTSTGDATSGTESGEAESGDTGGPTGPNLAFVTSTVQVPGDLGGLDGADAVCQARADEAGLTGTFVAWLSTTEVDGGDRIASARGWVRTDGRPFVDTVDDLFDRRQAFPLRIDENGDDVGAALTATATTHFGAARIEASAGTCEDWTNATAVLKHISGRTDAGAGLWTAGVTIPCDEPVHLYCFQIDHDDPLDIEPEPGRLAFLSLGEFEPITGLAAADTLCQDEANAAAFEGQFSALLSFADASAASRFDLDGENWVRLDGVPILESAGDLAVASQLLAPISFHADDTPVFNVLTWTGGASPGSEANAETCSDWSTGAGTGLAAVAGRSGADWYGDGSRSCDDASLRVYCLEQ
jgi:hypothetical protein